MIDTIDVIVLHKNVLFKMFAVKMIHIATVFIAKAKVFHLLF